ncbi:type I methionyl aminopeptidase [Patescibacteria group bacterium]
MVIKSQKQLNSYQKAADISTEILAELVDMVAPGIFPIEIDKRAEKLCKKHKVRPAFKGQEDLHSMYKFSTCISVNDTVVHGVPSRKVPIKKGDLVGVDFGVIRSGLYTDHCHTVGVGTINSKDELLLNSGRRSIQNGVTQAIVGKKVGDIGHAISASVKSDGYVIAKEFIGHSIGTRLWENPGVPPIGKKGTGQKLEEGLVLCIEAQVLAGSDKVYKADDGWTIKTYDGGNAVMFEYMVIVQKNQPLVLTDTLNWKILV